MVSGGDLVRRALRRLGVLGAVGDIAPEDMDLGLSILNGFVDSLGLEPGTMTTRLRTTKTLAAGTASYTIGTGGNIDIVRPAFIEKAGLITNTGDATPAEIARRIYRDEEWARITQKTLQSAYLEGIYYDHSFAAGLGRIFPWPIPNVASTQLVLYSPEAITQFTLAAQVHLPQGYERMLEYNLAVELADPFEKAASPLTLRVARDSKSRIKGANLRPSQLAMPAGLPGLRRGRGDIRAGG